MEELKTRFPDGVDYDIAYDTTPFIRESVGEVFKTLRDAVILVGLVVLVFLQDWRAMILPMIDVPVSLDRHVRRHGRDGLQPEQPHALRPGAGDRHRGRRRHRGAGEHRADDRQGATTRARPRSRRWRRSPGRSSRSRWCLSSVFVPCCFIGGITGQFFRQFAVTIAVSTIISAINALTMTPSRAVLIFKTEEGGHGARAQARGVAVVDLRRPGRAADRLVWAADSWPAGSACAVSAGAGEASLGELSWTVTGALVRPRRAGRRRWSAGSIIRPVNAVLGWLFRGFNRLFDADDRGLRLDGRQAAAPQRARAAGLRRPAGADLLDLPASAPTGFIPQQDQGRLIVNVQLPDSASLQRTQEAMAEVVRRSPSETPGVAHTVAIAGLSFLLQANSSNFGSMFIVLDPFDKRQKPRAARRRTSWPGCARSVRRRVKDARGRRVRIRRRSPAWASPAASSSWSRTAAAAAWRTLQQQTDELVRAP